MIPLGVKSRLYSFWNPSYVMNSSVWLVWMCWCYSFSSFYHGAVWLCFIGGRGGNRTTVLQVMSLARYHFYYPAINVGRRQIRTVDLCLFFMWSLHCSTTELSFQAVCFFRGVHTDSLSAVLFTQNRTAFKVPSHGTHHICFRMEYLR